MVDDPLFDSSSEESGGRIRCKSALTVPRNIELADASVRSHENSYSHKTYGQDNSPLPAFTSPAPRDAAARAAPRDAAAHAAPAPAFTSPAPRDAAAHGAPRDAAAHGAPRDAAANRFAPPPRAAATITPASNPFSSPAASSSTASASSTRRPTSTLPAAVIRPYPVSAADWLLALQEEKVESETKQTLAKSYPKVWKMVSTIDKHWKDSGWHMPTTAKNKTDFRRKVVELIVQSRRKVAVADLDSISASELFKTNKTYCWYYSLQDFKVHTEEQFKEKKTDNDLPDSSDIIRLFGILGMQEFRDDVVKLGKGKTTLREDVDGPLNLIDQVFYNVATHFNEVTFEVPEPSRADRLKSWGTPALDPNNVARFSVWGRDYKWLKKLYLDTLKKYNVSMKKWKMGTGGGSGYPENYSDWNTRDDELFGMYHACASMSDVLAWIYMLDKSLGFIFNAINSPPRLDSTLQDGVDITATVGKSGTKGGVKGGLDEFTIALTSAVTSVTNLLHSQSNETSSPNGNDVGETVALISMLQEQRNVAANDEDVGRRNKRLKTIQKALDQQFSKLE